VSRPAGIRPEVPSDRVLVLSGGYRDLEYAKTGLTGATMGARGEATLPRVGPQLSHSY